MRYYSTNDRSHTASFEQAVFRSLPPDNGLYFPEEIPVLSEHSLHCLANRSLENIAFEMMKPFVGDEIPDEELDRILHETLDFELPLRHIHDQIYCMELYHGPTWAFKDVGARFLARCMGYFTQQSGKEIDILVATSGDTGGAVAAGFFKVPGTRVTILYPRGKVSDVQEQQLTTWGENIRSFAVEGTFDDCQQMVKQAFLDEDLKGQMNLSSANSINVARFLPQSIYFAQICKSIGGDEVTIAVPSGNYGNLTAGLFAKRMGLPIKKFIAASNINKVVPDYLETAEFQPKASIATYSNAMDVGAPSNFVRMLELFDGSHQKMVEQVEGFFLDDEGTLQAMKDCYDIHHYLCDPHGAIAYQALIKNEPWDHKAVFLETAHPVKFLDVVDRILDEPVNYQEMTTDLMAKSRKVQELPNDFGAFKSALLSGTS